MARSPGLMPGRAAVGVVLGVIFTRRQLNNLSKGTGSALRRRLFAIAVAIAIIGILTVITSLNQPKVIEAIYFSGVLGCGLGFLVSRLALLGLYEKRHSAWIRQVVGFGIFAVPKEKLAHFEEA